MTPFLSPSLLYIFSSNGDTTFPIFSSNDSRRNPCECVRVNIQKKRKEKIVSVVLYLRFGSKEEFDSIKANVLRCRMLSEALIDFENKL